jgi:hypothetical protein
MTTGHVPPPHPESKKGLCACGRPLHYTDPDIQAAVQQLIDRKGEMVQVRVGDRCWLVQRHHIALHGLKARELPNLGFPEITGREARAASVN